MSVVLSIEDIGPCVKRLQVEVPAPAVEAETQRVAQRVGSKVSVPGFRKGKVPRGIVLQRFRDQINQDLLDRLLPRYWNQAAAEKEVDAMLPPRFEVDRLEPGESLLFSATVEVRPTFQLRNISDFELPELEAEPLENEVEKAIDDLRRQAGSWADIERPAAQGDQVEGILQDVTGDEPGPEQPIRIEVGDPGIWEELSLAVTGSSPGGETTFDRTVNEEERRFRVAVSAVRERELPPLDEEFAKKVGDFGSVQELEERVTEQLRGAREAESRRQRERAVLDQLRERHPFELPEGVVSEEIEVLLREYAENLVHRGVDLENAGIDWQDMAEKVRPQADRRVASRLLLDAIAEAKEIEVDENEFETTLAAIARSEGRSTVAVRQALDRAGRLGRLRADLRRESTLKHLLGEETTNEDEP